MASSFFSPFTWIGPSVTFSVASLCGKRLNSWKTMPHFMRIWWTSFLKLAAVAAADDVHAADLDLAGGRVLEEVEAAQEGALARAGRADEHDDLALVHLQVDALEHVVAAEVLLQFFDLDDDLAADGVLRSIRLRLSVRV